MKSYAVAVIIDTRFSPEVRRYLESIDQTLDPYGGKFCVHGGPYYELEGKWSGDLVIIEFPGMDSARNWYYSPEHQDIQPLRANNTTGTVILVAGVPEEHRAIDIL